MKTPINNKKDKRQTFTDEKEQDIFDFWLPTGHSESFLADKYGCSVSVINKVLNKGLERRKAAYKKEHERDKEAGQ